MFEPALFAQYVKDPSPQAFAALVSEYVNLVYGSARRQLADAHLAEDVTQAVFILLSQKARQIPLDRPLATWLLTTTRYVVANMRRERASRQKHERKASAMKREAMAAGDESKTCDDASSLLDEGLVSLKEADRDVLLLRFFESKTLRQVGESIGTSENAAEKRVARAIEHLREFFARKGVNIASATLSAGLSEKLLVGAPHGLTATILDGGPAGKAIASKITALQSKTVLAAMKVKIAASVAAALIAAGTGVAVIQYIDAKAPAATMVAPEQSPAQPAAGALAPSRARTADELYGLNPDEPIRIVRNAPQSVRNEMWTRLQSAQRASPTGKAHAFPAPDGPFAFDWSGAEPQRPLAYVAGQKTSLDLLIKIVVTGTTSLNAYEIETPADFSSQFLSIPGDIVYTDQLPLDKTLVGLEAMSRKELDVPLTLSLQNVDRKVFVMRGTFAFKQVEFKGPGNVPELMGNKPVNPLIELYGNDVFDANDAVAGDSISTPFFTDRTAGAWLANEISHWIGDRQIIVEAVGFPSRIGWRGHLPKAGTANVQAIARDPNRVLSHVCEQCGLTWTEETRHVRRLIVSPDGL